MVNLHLGVIYSKFLLFLVLFGFSTGIVEFQPNDTPCLNTFQEYHCNVSEGVGLQWRVRDSNDMQVGGTVTYTSDEIGAATTIEQFSFQHLEFSPDIISNVSFTVQSNMNGYSLECRRQSTAINEIFVIDIPDIPDSPSNVTIHTDTFTSTSVNISWTESNSSCVTVYRYNVSSVTVGSNITESITSDNVPVKQLKQSNEEYCVIVTAVDYADRTSNGSDPVCFIFDFPSKPTITSITNVTISSMYDNITVNWTVPGSNITVAPITAYIVNIFNTTDESMDDFYDTSDELHGTSTSYTFTDVPKETNYTIEVIAFNVVGNSTSTRFFPVPPQNEPSPSITTASTIPMSMSFTTSSSTTVSSSVTTSTTTTSSSSTTSQTSSIMPSLAAKSSSIAPIAGGVAAGAVILILLIVVVVLVLLYFFVWGKQKRKSVDLISNPDNPDGGKPMSLEDKNAPQIGQPLYQDVTDATNPPQALTKPQQQPASATVATTELVTTELATYQDPNTIRRQQAPSTGDLYALPQRGTPKEEQPIGGQYAELDLPNKTDPSSQTPAVVQGTVQPVIYSDVRGQ